MKCIIGIDGGGTKTHLCAEEVESGKICCEVFGGASNLTSNSAEQVADHLKGLFDQAKAQCPALTPVSVCLGTAGITAENAEKILSEILFKLTACEKIKVVGDMEIPLYANTENKDGVVLIAGTGSIGYARNISGEQARVGGWGHILGDEGSAYWIAKEAMNTLLRSYDGRCEETMLTDLLLQAFSTHTPKEIIAKIHDPAFNKAKMASYAQLVDQAAGKGDKLSLEILKRAGSELFQLFVAAKKSARLSDDLAVILVGGVFKHNSYVRRQVTEEILEWYPKAEIILSKNENVSGALKIARNNQ